MSADAAPATDSAFIDTLIDVMAKSGPDVAFRTALRTRSPQAVRAITRLAAPGLSLEELLETARRLDGDAPSDFDPEYACALAGVLHSQGDHEGCRALYSLADRYGQRPMPPEHLTWYVRSEFRCTGNVDRLADRLDRLPPLELLAVQADISHPSNGGDREAWLARFAQLTGMTGLKLDDDPNRPFFDRLSAGPFRPVKSNVSISIIMTCYRPGPQLLTAIRSVIAQSWQNWELLLVDDCSGAEFHPLLAEANAMDSRIKLLALPRNSGTYAARNRAFAECSGAVVTGLDSDDWAHPRWLERQVKPLLDDADIVMSVSSATRVHSDLTVTDSTRPLRGPRSTSIMFRARPVRQRMGFFDTVRKGADTEFRMRFAAVFGNRAISRVTDPPLTLVRLSEETLTSAEFGMGWIHPARWVYQSAQKQWHRRVRAEKEDPFMCAAATERPFFAPDLVLGHSDAPTVFDEVHIADCRFDEQPTREVLDRLKTAVGEGRHVGLLHAESLHRPTPVTVPIHQETLKALHEHGIAFVVHTDTVTTSRLVIAEATLWEGREAEYSITVNGPVEILSTEVKAVPWSASAEKGSPSPAPSPRPESPSPRPETTSPRRGIWSYRRHAMAALACVCLLAAAAWPLLGAPWATIATFAVASASLLALTLLSTSRGYLRLMAAVDRKRTR